MVWTTPLARGWKLDKNAPWIACPSRAQSNSEEQWRALLRRRGPRAFNAFNWHVACHDNSDLKVLGGTQDETGILSLQSLPQRCPPNLAGAPRTLWQDWQVRLHVFHHVTFRWYVFPCCLCSPQIHYIDHAFESQSHALKRTAAVC